MDVAAVRERRAPVKGRVSAGALPTPAQRKILAQYAATGILAEARDAAEALPKLLAAIAQALGWDLAAYWARGADGRLALAASWAADPATAALFAEGCAGLTFGPGEGLPGRVLEDGEATFSGDGRSDDRHVRARLAAEHGLSSALLFPVFCSRETFGVLEFVTRHEAAPDEELLQTMAGLGFQIGQFFDRTETERQLREALVREAEARAVAEAERNNLRALFGQAPAAIAILAGPELRYVLSNDLNQEFAGGRPLVGRTVREALPELEADGVYAVAKRVFDTGEPFVAREFPVTLPEAPGRPARRIFMNGVCQPLRGATGRVEGIMNVSWDVTDLVLARVRLEEAEERLRLAVDAAEIGTWELDFRVGLVEGNARFRALLGLPPDGATTPARIAEAIHPDDRARVEETARRSLDRASGGDYAIEYRIRGLGDGALRWVAARGRAFFDEEGRPRRFTGTIVDVTEQRRAVERVRFLGEATLVLSSSLDYRETLRHLADLAVPALADWCVVEVVNDDGIVEPVAIAHADPALLPLAEEARRRYSPAADAPSGVARVLATGASMLTSEISDELLAAVARDAEHLRLLRAVGLRSSMLVPLKVRDETIGVLGLFQAASGRRYGQEDLALAEELGRRAAIAIENARLYERAQRAIGVRDQFVSIASHELRTPLTSLTLQLSGFSRALATGRFAGLAPDALGAKLARMERQADRLTALVDELLDVSRVSTGRLVLVDEEVDLVEIAREVLARLGDEADRAATALELVAPAALVGRWDGNRLDQVVTNLVANALKYASGKPVEVTLEDRGELAQLRVRDHGPGIAESDQRRIFDQFERAASPNLGGLGLGLWIVKKIVEAHRGRVHVESSPRAGATFIVELPLEIPTS